MGSEQVRRSAPVLFYGVLVVGLVMLLATSVSARQLSNVEAVSLPDSEGTVTATEVSQAVEDASLVDDDFCVPQLGESADEVFERCFSHGRLLGDYSPPGPNHNTHPPGH